MFPVPSNPVWGISTCVKGAEDGGARRDTSLWLQSTPHRLRGNRVNRRRYHITLIIQRDTIRDVFPLA